MTSVAGSHQRADSNMDPEDKNMVLQVQVSSHSCPDITALTNDRMAQIRARQYSLVGRHTHPGVRDPQN